MPVPFKKNVGLPEVPGSKKKEEKPSFGGKPSPKPEKPFAAEDESAEVDPQPEGEELAEDPGATSGLDSPEAVLAAIDTVQENLDNIRAAVTALTSGSKEVPSPEGQLPSGPPQFA
jgi:hypothetical protein